MANYLYLFYDVLQDYTSGIAGAIASNKDDAISKIMKQFKNDKLNNKFYNHVGTTSYTSSQLKSELKKCKKIVKLPLDTEYAFYIGGSG